MNLRFPGWSTPTSPVPPPAAEGHAVARPAPGFSPISDPEVSRWREGLSALPAEGLIGQLSLQQMEDAAAEVAELAQLDTSWQIALRPGHVVLAEEDEAQELALQNVALGMGCTVAQLDPDVVRMYAAESPGAAAYMPHVDRIVVLKGYASMLRRDRFQAALYEETIHLAQGHRFPGLFQVTPEYQAQMTRIARGRLSGPDAFEGHSRGKQLLLMAKAVRHGADAQQVKQAYSLRHMSLLEGQPNFLLHRFGKVRFPDFFGRRRLTHLDGLMLSSNPHYVEGVHVFEQLLQRPHLIETMLRYRGSQDVVFGPTRAIRDAAARTLRSQAHASEADVAFIRSLKRIPRRLPIATAIRVWRDPRLRREYNQHAVGVPHDG